MVYMLIYTHFMLKYACEMWNISNVPRSLVIPCKGQECYVCCTGGRNICYGYSLYNKLCVWNELAYEASVNVYAFKRSIRLCLNSQSSTLYFVYIITAGWHYKPWWCSISVSWCLYVWLSLLMFTASDHVYWMLYYTGPTPKLVLKIICFKYYQLPHSHWNLNCSIIYFHMRNQQCKENYNKFSMIMYW
jgi:hypothetical protein